MAQIEKKSIGESLIESGLLTPEQLKKAEEEARRTGLPIERVLVKLEFVTDEETASLRAQRIGIPYLNLADYVIDSEIISLVPEEVARKCKLIPVFKISNTLTVAMANPQDVVAIDEVKLKSKCDVEAVLASETAIAQAVEQYYGVIGSVEEVIKEIDKDKLKALPEEAEAKDLEQLAKEAPVVKLVNIIIMDAVKSGASDIHLEPDEQVLRTRFRIDGILHEVATPPKHLQSAVISRVKVLSKMDIAEKRKPQDGRIQLKVINKDIDIRVSTFPTIYGENVVMRILDKTSILIGLKDLGFHEDVLNKYEKLIRRPYGIILVTGPTGSGKTTTLYASLQTINSIDKNIITIEDPVEYNLKLIRQTQINPKAGVTFASGLRAILRQDPDIIMVGEIRDKETADIAIQAALTGHLVLSTLHTNDAPGALTRLIDMGVEPFLVSSSVIGVIAQRLVRLICTKCKQPMKPTTKMLEELGIKETKDLTFYVGKGCNQCNNTGYKGRIGIFELMIVDESVRELVLARASTDQIRKKAQEKGMKLLREDGLVHVYKGLTTVEEILRATHIEEL